MLTLDAIPEAPTHESSAKTPVILADTMREKIKRLAEVSRQYKDLEAEKKMLEGDIKAAAEPMRIAYCKQTGKLAASIHLNGLAMYTAQNRYSACSLEQAGEMGIDWFTKETELEVDASKLTSEAVAALMACGAVKRKTFYKPTTAFHVARSMNMDVAAKADALGIKPVQTLKVS